MNAMHTALVHKVARRISLPAEAAILKEIARMAKFIGEEMSEVCCIDPEDETLEQASIRLQAERDHADKSISDDEFHSCYSVARDALAEIHGLIVEKITSQMGMRVLAAMDEAGDDSDRGEDPANGPTLARQILVGDTTVPIPRDKFNAWLDDLLTEIGKAPDPQKRNRQQKRQAVGA